VVVASDARQSGITLRQVARMVELNPRLAEQTQVFQSRLYVPRTDSTLVVLPAEPGALQGWNPSLAIIDELHVITGRCGTPSASRPASGSRTPGSGLGAARRQRLGAERLARASDREGAQGLDPPDRLGGGRGDGARLGRGPGPVADAGDLLEGGVCIFPHRPGGGCVNVTHGARRRAAARGIEGGTVRERRPRVPARGCPVGMAARTATAQRRSRPS
jgi:hypothetical protein